ncbi:RCC1/BLIP-II [Hypoxylon sp. FL1284]|nr:RCC1/BLIP-II [Hypoxylon sp. FL1284]
MPSQKRKAFNLDNCLDHAKRARAAYSSYPSDAVPASLFKVVGKLNEPPITPLDVFVFGEGAGGELGLGSKTIGGSAPLQVKRPRLNQLLSARDVGVVQVSCGALHGLALTRDNQILSWGVNDHGALGRDTTVEEDDDDELNPAESTPGRVETYFTEYIRWAQVVCCDNASFALTTDGRVFGWGTFRGIDGILGFEYRSMRAQKHPVIQKAPLPIPGLKDITQLATGNNHVLALDKHGRVFTWGCGDQGQLGRQFNQRNPRSGLTPSCVSLLPLNGTKVVKVACGAHHSFALSADGRTLAWGLNNYGQLGNPDQVAGSGAYQLTPILSEGLEHYTIVDIAGGEHHSLAVTDEGLLLTWGRIDTLQTGLPATAFTEKNSIFDKRNRPRILAIPTVLPKLPAIASVAAGTNHNFALTAHGKVFSWGRSWNGCTGHDTEDDVETPTLLDNPTSEKVVFTSARGDFSILACAASVAYTAKSRIINWFDGLIKFLS